MTKIEFEFFSQMRLGVLKNWSEKSIENHLTPSYLLYTRAGHIPHLTWNLVKKYLKFYQKPILQLTLPTMFDLTSKIQNNEGNFYFNIPQDFATHLSFLDPLGKRDVGFNNNASVAIWVKGGRQNINSASLKQIIDKLQIDSFSTLFDYDTSKSAYNKRLSKSVNRSLNFNHELCNLEKPLAFVTLGGGFSCYFRKQHLEQVLAKGVKNAYSIDLSMFSLNNNIQEKEKFSKIEIESLIYENLKMLPKNSLRLTEGAFSPSEILFLFKLGIDLFDSSYAVYLAEEGKTFKLGSNYPSNENDYKITNFNEKRYINDFSPVNLNCSCYTCKNYTKAYLQHLQNTKEMLSQILLVIHNLMEFDKMFYLIREHYKK